MESDAFLSNLAICLASLCTDIWQLKVKKEKCSSTCRLTVPPRTACNWQIVLCQLGLLQCCTRDNFMQEHAREPRSHNHVCWQWQNICWHFGGRKVAAAAISLSLSAQHALLQFTFPLQKFNMHSWTLPSPQCKLKYFPCKNFISLADFFNLIWENNVSIFWIAPSLNCRQARRTMLRSRIKLCKL